MPDTSEVIDSAGVGRPDRKNTEFDSRGQRNGYFSGCIMARYKKVGGAWRVCHVSTGEPNDCQNAWANMKETQIASRIYPVVSEFKPHAIATGCMRVLGLITSTGGCYAIGCTPVAAQIPETRTEEEIFSTAIGSETQRRNFARQQVNEKTRTVQSLKIEKMIEV